MHIHAGNIGIRTREVDILHRSDGDGCIVGIFFDRQAVVVNDRQFAGVDVADKIRADRIDGTRFAGHHIRAIRQLADDKRTE
ncbi:hypothetical protein SDC9_60285 [bioreactor metagenome]|uniref:Uncharacterized protein n=1 Tax=bioreactor metagenome TaxID=1076179 RepID=A0A644XCK5_9ZZZZ